MREEVYVAKRKRRKFTAEFKAEVVALCRQGDRSIGEVSRDLDLTSSSVRNWLAQFADKQWEKLGDDANLAWEAMDPSTSQKESNGTIRSILEKDCGYSHDAAVSLMFPRIDTSKRHKSKKPWWM